jgi:hypothetical protein
MYQEQLEKTKSTLSGVQAEIETATRHQAEQQALLERSDGELGIVISVSSRSPKDDDEPEILSSSRR